MSKERRLGRGLEALLGRTPQPKENPATAKPVVLEEPKTDAGSVPTSVIAKPAESVEPVMPAGPANLVRPITPMSARPAAPMDTRPAVPMVAGPITPPPASGSGIGRQNHPSQSGGSIPLSSVSPIEIAKTQTQTMPMQTPPTKENKESSDNEHVMVKENKESSDNEHVMIKESKESSDNDHVMVNVALIETNPFQPRKQFDEVSMAELSESIAAHGLLQPIVARRVDDVYQLIAGERRLRAAQKAGWEEVPVRVIETDERGVAELAIVENLQRKDLNALEKAASFKRYLKEHRCTQGQLANRLKIDRSTIANFMRLLELPEEVQNAISTEKITPGHARALLSLGEQDEQVAFCRRIQRDGLSVRKTETLVQEMIKAADAEPLSLVGRDGRCSKSSNTADHLASLEQEFRLGLGSKVKITQGSGGRGKLVIQFKSHEEFNRIKEHILGPKTPQAKAG